MADFLTFSLESFTVVGFIDASEKVVPLPLVQNGRVSQAKVLHCSQYPLPSLVVIKISDKCTDFRKRNSSKLGLWQPCALRGRSRTSSLITVTWKITVACKCTLSLGEHFFARMRSFTAFAARRFQQSRIVHVSRKSLALKPVSTQIADFCGLL